MTVEDPAPEFFHGLKAMATEDLSFKKIIEKKFGSAKSKVNG